MTDTEPIYTAVDCLNGLELARVKRVPPSDRFRVTCTACGAHLAFPTEAEARRFATIAHLCRASS